MLELADKNIKTVVITVFFVQKLETWKRLKKTQIEFVENETTICDIKDTLEIHNRFDIAEEKKKSQLEVSNISYPE